MTVATISTLNFRNLANQDLILHKRLNLIVGENGSGKTSCLESVYSLTSGRSFRTQKLESIITRTENSDAKNAFVLFGTLHKERSSLEGASSSTTSVGIKKSITEKTQIKIDGEMVSSAAQLAQICPTLVIEPENFNLLAGTTKQRRKFLDWGVFHVEHSFAALWKNYSHCLKQRNSLLKNLRGANQAQFFEQQLSAWDAKLHSLGSEIDELRQSFFDRFIVEAKAALIELDFPYAESMSFSYRKGWDRNLGFGEALQRNLDKDIERTYTSVGPHRMDVRITIASVNASETLSRGQQKILIVALYMALVRVLRALQGVSCLVLLDDLEAELDYKNVGIVLNQLLALDCQLLCTALKEDTILSHLNDTQEYTMFHVEHGQIRRG